MCFFSFRDGKLLRAVCFTTYLRVLTDTDLAGSSGHSWHSPPGAAHRHALSCILQVDTMFCYTVLRNLPLPTTARTIYNTPSISDTLDFAPAAHEPHGRLVPPVTSPSHEYHNTARSATT